MSDQTKQLVSVIQKYGDQIKMALPKQTLDPDRIVRLFVTQVRKNEKLAYCDPISVMGSIVRVAQLGIAPELAYLIPFKKDCNVIIDYRGECELARRHPDVNDVEAFTVRANDEFYIDMGESKLVHKIANPFDRGDVIGYYAVARMASGRDRICEPMSTAEVEAHRDKFATSKNSPAWRDSFDEMAKKTVLRRICKTLPQAQEVATAMALDDSAYKVSQNNHLILDAAHETEANTTASATTIAAVNAEGRAEAEERARKTVFVRIETLIDQMVGNGADPTEIEKKIGHALPEIELASLDELNAIWEILNA